MIDLAGIKIDNVTIDEAVKRSNDFIIDGSPHLIVTPNPEMIVAAQDDLELRNILNNAQLRLPDGISMIVVSKILMKPLLGRVTGIDFLLKAVELSAAKGYRIFLLGGGEGVAEKAAQDLLIKYPSLNVAGTHHGYFKNSDEAKLIESIRNAHPDILFAGLGMGKQEKWLAANLNEMNVPVCVGVGGSFDVISGVKQRAPLWAQRMYVEWLYRLIMEPWRIKRQAALPKFLWLTLIQHGIMQTKWLKKLF